MTDLVKRLRSKHCCTAETCNCDEAADEIERLQAELDAQRDALENVRLLAARYRNTEWARHMLRFVEQAGNTAQVLRSSPPSVPEGWQLVPVVPTDEMLKSVRLEMEWCNPVGIFSKMLKAAPKPGERDDPR